jgi:phosphoglycolate phosphatase (TIGR01487 family)
LNSSKTREIKAVITDIDGTITNDKRELSTEAVQALRDIESKGIPVMLASGNVLPIAYGLSAFIGTSGPIIAENGGIIKYKDEVKQLASRNRCDNAYELLKKHLPVRKIFTDRWRVTELAVEANVDINEVRTLLLPLKLKVETTGFAIHIFELGISKYSAAKIACEMIGTNTDSIAAFGDSENDIEMIKNCGIGIAPSNAMDEVKKAADHVTKSPYGKGVVEGLEHLGLI